MAAHRPDVVKIAVTARSVADLGRLLAFASRRAGAPGPRLVALAMGPLGVASRILGGRYGAPFTFASPENGREAAPGPAAGGRAGRRLPRPVDRPRDARLRPPRLGRPAEPLARDPEPRLRRDRHGRRLRSAAGRVDGRVRHGPARPRALRLQRDAPVQGRDPASPRLGHPPRRRGGVGEHGRGAGRPARRPEHRRRRRPRPSAPPGRPGRPHRGDRRRGRRGPRRGVRPRSRGRARHRPGAAAGAGGRGGVRDRLRLRRARRPLRARLGRAGQRHAPRLRGLPGPARPSRPGRCARAPSCSTWSTSLARRRSSPPRSARGCATIDGVEMLVAQAVGQFEAWTGAPAPVEAMTGAALEAMAEARAARPPGTRECDERDSPAGPDPARGAVLRGRGGPAPTPGRGVRGVGLRGLGLRGDHPSPLRLRRRLLRRGPGPQDLLVRGPRRKRARPAARLHEPRRQDRGGAAARPPGADAPLLLGRGRALRAGEGGTAERAAPDGPRAPRRRRARGRRRGARDRRRVPGPARGAGLRPGPRPRGGLRRPRRGGGARRGAPGGAARARRVEGPGGRAPGPRGGGGPRGHHRGARAADRDGRRARDPRRGGAGVRLLRSRGGGGGGAARGGLGPARGRPRRPPGRGPRRGARPRLLHRPRLPRVRSRPRLRGGRGRPLRHAPRALRPPAAGRRVHAGPRPRGPPPRAPGGASRTPSAPAVAIRGADLGEALTQARRERAAGARVRFGNGGAP